MDEKSEPAQPNELPPHQQSEGENDCSDGPADDPTATARYAGASLESELIAMSLSEVAKT